MADEQDYKHYYLPFLSGNNFRNTHKRRAIPTAFVEFCDIGKPGNLTDIPREYHNQFKPSSLCLPKIQPRYVREKETLLDDIPVHSTLPLTNNKVPCTFTEGLSALSAPKPPLFPLQRMNVPSANLPNDIKVSEEKIRGQYSVQRRCTQDDTPRRKTLTVKHIPLKRDGKLEPTVPEMKNLECRPFLKFAPNVIYNKRPQKNTIDLRSYTPYKENTKCLVVPKEIGLTELDDVPLLRQKSFGNFYQEEINRLRLKKSNNKLSTTCVLGVSSVSNKKLELPFTVLRERHASKPFANKSSITLDLTSSEFPQYKDDSEERASVRFVIKMPITTDMYHKEISEVANLNNNNSNNQESSFEIDECHSYFVLENRDQEEVDDTRLLSIEPIDIICESIDSTTNLSPCIFGDNNQDLTKKSDIVSHDSETALDTKINNSVYTSEEKCGSNSEKNELDQNDSKCIKEVDIDPKHQNMDDIPTELDVLNSSDGAKKKLRLEVIVLKKTPGNREITTQMYYS